MPTALNSTQRRAVRTSALLYFLMMITAPVGLLYVPGQLIIPGDPAKTADLIRNSEWLLRIGIGSELFHQAIAVFLVLALYRLFRPVDEGHAKLLVALGALVSVPIMFLNVLNEIAALVFLSGSDFLTSFDTNQLNTLAYVFLRLHEQGINIAAIFWGLWLFPFGILVIRSGFIPRILGYLLYVAAFGYVLASCTALLLPHYDAAVGQVALILELGEIPVAFWFYMKAVWPGQAIENERATA